MFPGYVWQSIRSRDVTEMAIVVSGWQRFRDGSELSSVLDSGENRLGYWAIATTLYLVLVLAFIFLAAR